MGDAYVILVTNSQWLGKPQYFGTVLNI